MSTTAYHHGDLRNALIEAGIAYINKNGTNQLSLRKVAAECGVSHTAPYSHFKDKEDLLEAMKNYVSDKFAEALQRALNESTEQGSAFAVRNLGKAYVGFFNINPQYYEFIFERADFDIDLDDLDKVNSYKPFEIFKNAVKILFDERGLSRDRQRTALIEMWGLVHGLAGISVMKGIKFSGNWPEITQKIIIIE